MTRTTSKRFNLFACILVVALLVLAGVAIYVRLAGGGTDVEQEERKPPTFSESLTMAAEAQAKGLRSPYGYYEAEITLGSTVLESEVYHFAGNAIQISMSPTVSGGEGVNNYFTIELHRIEAGVVDVLVGSQTTNREFHAFADWQDTPEGDYYFVFKKDADNQVITATDVVMQGYWVE